MRLSSVLWTLGRGAACLLLGIAQAQNAAPDLAREAGQLEAKGEATQAAELLSQAAQRAPENPAVLRAYADFLGRHNDRGARAAYEKLSTALARTGASPDQRAAVDRRLAILDLLAGDRDAAARHLAAYHKEGGSELNLPAARVGEAAAGAYIEITGPLKGFARMAALSPDLPPSDVLPALARNIVTNGYQALSASEGLEQTEYLKLVVRYLS